jgi:hypothetical protein
LGISPDDADGEYIKHKICHVRSGSSRP